MNRITRFLLEKAEKLLGRWYEGPEPPARLREAVLAFRTAHPEASPDEWARAAIRIAEDAYRAAYVRGIETLVRDPGRWEAPDYGNDIGEELPERTYFGDGDPDDPLRGASPKDRVELMRSLAKAYDVGYQVVSIPEKESKR